MTDNQHIKDTVRRLSGRLRVEMNGAVSASMRESGVSYRLNYGVSLPTIRDIASEYRGDYELSCELYRSQVRELRLSAVFIARAEDVRVGDLDFWREGITSREVAEQLALNIVAQMDGGCWVALEWLGDQSDFVCYCAMMSLSAAMRKAAREGLSPSDLCGEKVGADMAGNVGANEAENLTEKLLAAMDLAVEKARSAGMLWHGALTMLAAMAGVDLQLKNRVAELVEQLKNSDDKWQRNLASELEWQLE